MKTPTHLYLGEYEKLDRGKKGSFAVVYKVRHHSLGYVRAVRQLINPISEEKDYEVFHKECVKLLKLGNGYHSNIIHIYKVGLYDDLAFMEMEYVYGDNIHDFLKKNDYFIPVDEVVTMATQISSALAYCHEDVYRFLMNPDTDKLPEDCLIGDEVKDEKLRENLIHTYGIVHNDIHPGNIMRRHDGSFVLLDFGLAFDGDEQSMLSSTRSHGGSIISRAPELWDSITIPTVQSDIYSFGIVLYQCLAGTLPFPAPKDSKDFVGMQKLSEAHKHTPPPPITNSRAHFYNAKFGHEQKYKCDYPQWLEEVILKCLEKDPSLRYQNGKALHEDIKKKIKEYEEQKHKEELAHYFAKNNMQVDLHPEVEQLKKENRELSEKNRTLLETNKSLNKRLDSAQNQLNQLLPKIEQLKKKIEKFFEENKQLREENNSLYNKLSDEKHKRRWTIFWFVFWIIAAVAVAAMAFMYLDRVYIEPCKDVEADYHKPITEIVDSLNHQLSQKDQQILQRDSTIKKQHEDIKNIIVEFNK